LAPPTVTLLTAEGPYADLIRMGQELCDGDVANVSVAGGFVFSDLPKCGMTVTVTTRGDEAAARRVALAITRRGWAERGRHTRRLLSLEDAVALAHRAAEGATKPVILSDAADNPGGGGRGNTTWLLAALHAAQVPGVVLGVFVDPDGATEAHVAGEGAHIQAVFNRVESEFSKRMEVGATIEKLTDGSAIGRRGVSAGKQFNLGPSALLRLDGSGVRVVVGSLRRQLAEPVMLEMHGIDIAAAKCVVVKSRGHFRAGFDEYFAPEQVFEVDTPGLTSPILANFPWKRLPRPVFPLDLDARWQEPEWA
jgi:microcystin degradation protein MlrC